MWGYDTLDELGWGTSAARNREPSGTGRARAFLPTGVPMHVSFSPSPREDGVGGRGSQRRSVVLVPGEQTLRFESAPPTVVELVAEGAAAGWVTVAVKHAPEGGRLLSREATERTEDGYGVHTLVLSEAGRYVITVGAADLADVDVDVEVEVEARAEERMRRELLINAAKHSGAQCVRVRLQCEEEQLNAVIEDDGVGMDPELALAKGSGLVSIRERLTYVWELAHRVGPRTWHEDPPERAAQGQLVREQEVRGMKVRVLLVDDHKMMREGLIALLASVPDIEVIGEVPADGHSALDLVRTLAPDVVVMDVGMPLLNGIETTGVGPS